MVKNPPVSAGGIADVDSISEPLDDLMEWKMSTHSSILAWKIPWTEELVGYSPRGRKKSDTTEQLSTHKTQTYISKDR